MSTDPETLEHYRTENARMKQALTTISAELACYHNMRDRPSADELWGMYIKTMHGLGSMNLENPEKSGPMKRRAG